MKKILLTLVLAAVSLPLLSDAATIEFDSVSGFSDTQGGNGWSYAGIYFSDLSATSTSLWNSSVAATYNEAESTWYATISGVSVKMSATQQNYTTGLSRFSVRYWTADQAYQTVAYSCEITPVSDVTVRIYRQASSGSDQVILDSYYYKGGPYDTHTISGTVSNVAAGERIYLVLSNVGGGANSNAMQTVSLTLTATTIPEASSFGLVGSLLGLGGVCLWRKRMRRV